MLYPSINGRVTRDHVGKARTFLTTTVSTLFIATAITLWPNCALSPHFATASASGNWLLFHMASAPVTRPNDIKRLAIVNKPVNRSLYQLGNSDRILYKRVFTAQSRQDWQQANALLHRVHDPVLVGQVLFARYTAVDTYRASYHELRDWMLRYGDHPEAYRIYQLAQQRRADDPAALPTPPLAAKLFDPLEFKWLMRRAEQEQPAQIDAEDTASNAAILGQTIRAQLARGDTGRAMRKLLSSSVQKTLEHIQSDILLGEVAARYYYDGHIVKALKLAAQAAMRSGADVPTANWIAGLAAWRMGDYARSGGYFQTVAHAHVRNPWLLSAGAYWAARAADKQHDAVASNAWLLEAANYDRTFYGLIANAALNDEDKAFLVMPRLTPVAIDTLGRIAGGKRALALIDIGKNDFAEQELLQIQPGRDRALQKALVAAALRFKFDNLATHLGTDMQQVTRAERPYYPVVPFKGDRRARVNPALINALIRQESRFDPNASNSRTGARGLMQLMPSTAEAVSDVAFNAKDMHDPEVNVALGQRYVRYLLDRPQIKGNLFYLAAAYNAGPGKLAKWQRTIDIADDPLLFAESLPAAETRSFIQRVMTNYWVYNTHLQQDSDTLDSVADGDWPMYQPAQKPLDLASNL